MEATWSLAPASSAAATPSVMERATPGRADVAALLVALVTATLAWWSVPLVDVEQFRVPKELAVLALTGVAAALAARRATRWRVDSVMALGAACLAWALLGLALRAHNPWLGWRLLGGYWTALLAYALVRRHVHEASVRAALLAGIACIGGLVTITALLEHVGVIASNSLLHRAPSGVFGHRNQAAHFIALSLPATLALLRPRLRRGALARAWLLPAIGITFAAAGGAAVVVTRSRASWLAVLAAAAIAAFTLLLPRAGVAAREGAWSHRRATIAWLAALLIGGSLGAVAPSALEWRGSLGESAARIAEYEQGSGRGRLVQYATTLRIARAHPLLGVGAGNWSVQYPRFARRGDPNIANQPAPTGRLPLSDWMGTLSEGGAPLLALVALLALVVAVPAARAVVRRRTTALHTADVALLMLLAEVIVLGSLDAVVQNALPAVFVAVGVAVLARRGMPARVVPMRAGWRRALVVLVVATTAASSALAARRLAAMMQYGDDPHPTAFMAAAWIDPTDYIAQFFSAYGFIRAHDCTSARPYLRAAAALQPYAPAVAALGRRCRPGRVAP